MYSRPMESENKQSVINGVEALLVKGVDLETAVRAYGTTIEELEEYRADVAKKFDIGSAQAHQKLQESIYEKAVEKVITKKVTTLEEQICPASKAVQHIVRKTVVTEEAPDAVLALKLLGQLLPAKYNQGRVEPDIDHGIAPPADITFVEIGRDDEPDGEADGED